MTPEYPIHEFTPSDHYAQLTGLELTEEQLADIKPKDQEGQQRFMKRLVKTGVIVAKELRKDGKK